MSPIPEARLVFRNGPFRGRVAPLLGDRITVGRGSGNDIAIDAGMVVSTAHAAFVREPAAGGWSIEDLDSKNGTYLNGERIAGRARLSEGDIISFALTGPEAQFTQLPPALPGLIETTLTTFRRTRSIPAAARELLPAAFSRASLTITGVERALDRRLEAWTRRLRWMAFSAGLALLALILAGAGLLVGGLIGRSRAPAPAAAVELIPHLEPIYGCLFLTYREHPIGSVEAVNRGSNPLSGLRLTFGFLRAAEGFLAEPFSAPLPELPPGGSVEVEIRPRLSTEVLSPRTREVTAVIRLFRGDQAIAEEARAVFVHGRNVFNWQKPERIAAFIDPQDPAVTELVQSAWRRRPAPVEEDPLPPTLRDGACLIAALADLDLRYLPDAETPISAKVDWKASDRVKYPWETLLGRTGDCDDLAVLGAAALAAVKIPAAIGVGPRHVLLLFDAGLDAAAVAFTPLDPESVVPWGGRAWIPIETTELGRVGGTFEKAWAAGRGRREEILSGEMQVVEVEAGWKDYPPMPPAPDAAAQEKLAGTAWAAEDLTAKMQAVLKGLRSLFTEER